jgi:RNA polymerase sigma factor (sigma-70 family)
MQRNHDDIALVTRIASGDHDAEKVMFSRLNEKIKFLVRIRLKNHVSRPDQEDIVVEIQEAVLHSLRNGKFDPERGKTLSAYIAGIASHIVGQYFRKRAREPVRQEIDVVEIRDGGGGSLTGLINDETRTKLLARLNKLKPKYRQVLHLRIYEDKSIEEIAHELNIEKRRVSERIHYAFKLLLKECKKDKYFQYYHQKSK